MAVLQTKPSGKPTQAEEEQPEDSDWADLTREQRAALRAYIEELEHLPSADE
jgi:hypothetical protein